MASESPIVFGMTVFLAVGSAWAGEPTPTYASSDANASWVSSNAGVSLDAAPVAEPAFVPPGADPMAVPSDRASAPTVSEPFRDRMPSRRADRIAPNLRAAGSNWLGSVMPPALVLGLIGLGAWGVRRWKPSIRAGHGGVLRVVARSALAPRHSAVLVQVGRRLLLLGISADRMATLCEVTDPDEVLELLARGGEDKSKREAFDGWLTHESASYRPSDEAREYVVEPSTRGSETPPPVARLLTRLRSLQRL